MGSSGGNSHGTIPQPPFWPNRAAGVKACGQPNQENTK